MKAQPHLQNLLLLLENVEQQMQNGPEKKDLVFLGYVSFSVVYYHGNAPNIETSSFHARPLASGVSATLCKDRLKTCTSFKHHRYIQVSSVGIL